MVNDEKFLHSEGHPERFTVSMEKIRGRREIEVTRRRRRGIKQGESQVASNHFLCALHSLDPSEMFTELHREEKREEGDRGGQEEKRGNQKEQDRSSQ